MRPSRTPRNRGLAAVSGAAVVLIACGVLIAPLSASAYPTWSEVEAAKGDASATKRQVQTITSSLDSLESTAATASEAALKADAANSTAQQKLAVAKAQASALAAQVSSQKKKADEAHQEAGQLAAHLYRIGGSSLDSQLLTGTDADKTLYKLGALSQLTTQWQTVLDQATVASRSVSSLEAQAKVAADERDTLASKAASTLASAQTAQQAADDEVASATAHQKTLYAQLASLNDTTASLEKRYRQGVAAKAAYAAALAKKAADARAAAAAAAQQQEQAASGSSGSGASGSGSSSGDAGSSGSGGTPVSSGGSGGSSGGSLGSGVVDDPAGAQAYARGALPSYGWASSEMSCLVSLWNQESGWRTSALNVSSGAYGIPQALPAIKLSSAGLDWQTSYRTQITWGLGYIKSVYGSPCGAWSHEVAHNWY